MEYTLDLIPTMTDYTTPSGEVFITCPHISYPGYAAFDDVNPADDNPPYSWLTTIGYLPVGIGYHFTSDKKIVKYTVTSRNSGVNIPRSPKSWTFQASTTGVWGGEEVTLDTQTDITDWAATDNVKKIFTITNTNLYSYYRLYITASNDGSYVGIGEMEMMEALSYSSDLIPIMTGYTTPSGVAFVSSLLAGYEGWYVFDKISIPNDYPGYSWATPISNLPADIGYQFTSGKIITKYTVTTRNTGINLPRALKSWTFQGSNDGVNYTTLDTQTNITDWAASDNVKKTFLITNTTSYTYYRLHITASNDGEYVGVGEMEMMESIIPSVQKTIISDTKIKVIDIQKTIDSDTKIVGCYQKTINSEARIIKQIQEEINSDTKIKVIDNQKFIDSDTKIVFQYQKEINSDAAIANQIQKEIDSNTKIKVIGAQKTIDSDTNIVILVNEIFETNLLTKVLQNKIVKTILNTILHPALTIFNTNLTIKLETKNITYTDLRTRDIDYDSIQPKSLNNITINKEELLNFLTGGTATADNEYYGYPASRACDGLLTEEDGWYTYDIPLPTWWKYDLGIGITRKAHKLKIFSASGGQLKNFKLQGSNNNSTWTDLYIGIHSTPSAWEEYNFINNIAYRYYRLYIVDNWRLDGYCGMVEIELS